MTHTGRFRKLRGITINLLGGKCEECGIDVTGNIKIAHLHHRDRNHEDDTKNNIEHVCDKCHVKIHSGKAKVLD